MSELKPCPFCGNSNLFEDYTMFEKSKSMVYEIEYLRRYTHQFYIFKKKHSC